MATLLQLNTDIMGGNVGRQWHCW